MCWGVEVEGQCDLDMDGAECIMGNDGLCKTLDMRAAIIFGACGGKMC